MATIFVELVNFVANKLGIELKPFGIEKHQFGAACVTSLGMLGMEDAIAPFSGNYFVTQALLIVLSLYP